MSFAATVNMQRGGRARRGCVVPLRVVGGKTVGHCVQTGVIRVVQQQGLGSTNIEDTMKTGK